MPEASLPPAVPLHAPPSSALAALWVRIRHRLWLKIIGVSAWNWVFFLGYFALLRHPVNPVTTMPLTPVDDWVPFQPALLAAYLSLWFYVGIAPGLMLRFREMLAYGVWAAALCVAGLACFFFWPTAVPLLQPPDVAQYPGFALLQGVDAPGNACPSMHVASAVFTGFWVDSILRQMGLSARWRWFNGLWCAAIVYSTMAVKQHVFLDVVAGLALGGVFAFLSLRARHHAWGTK